MDTASLVKKLEQVFLGNRKDGIYIDGIGITAAYHGLVSDSFVLAVSAPSLKNMDYYEKVEAIVKVLFESMNLSERRLIHKVKVYDSLNELEEVKSSDYEELECSNYGSFCGVD